MIRFPNLSLRQILIASLMTQVLVAVGLTGYFSWRNGQKTVEALALRLSREATSHTEKHVAHYLDTPTTFLKLNRVLASSQRLDLSDLQDLQDSFWQQTQINPQINTLYFGNEMGDFVEIEMKDPPKLVVRDAKTAPYWHIYGLDERGNKTELISKKEYDPRQRPWYQAAKKQQDLVWSPVYLFADPPVLGITPAVPLQDVSTNQLQGVMAIDITLNEISEFLNGLKISDSGRAFIIERSGKMIATSTNNSLVVAGDAGNQRLHYRDSTDALVKATAKYLETQANNFQITDITKQFIFKHQNSRNFVQATSLNGYPGLDWLMVTVIPESDFARYMRQNTYTTIGLSTIALVAAIFLGAIANQLIINSVTHISDAAKAIAKGQIPACDKQPTIRDFAQVKEAINSIALQLKTSTENIEHLEWQYEQRVAESTKSLQQDNQRLNYLANIDSLTQIHNRHHFDQALSQLWNEARQQHKVISLIMCDVDNFKLFNDTYGHLMGDRCLAAVAQAIKRGVGRQQDIVARYGGEEFAVILPQTNTAGVAAVAQRIISCVYQLNLAHTNSMVSDRVTISCGVASIIPQINDSPLELLQKADQALYQAKRQGKNRYMTYSST
ncbi:MAG: diguanylate cyclase [Cyanobacteria bacterium P01_C01_bin.72]